MAIFCANAAEIERERFRLTLPEGWSEAKETNQVVIVGDNSEALEKRFPRFIASTKDCSCIISFAPRSQMITAQTQSALLLSSFRRGSTVYREAAITLVGGREGSGAELMVRHPYPVVSVVRVFAFEEANYICTLLITTSDPDEKPAVQRMTRRWPDIEAIAKSVKIRAPEDDVRKTN